MSSEVGLRPIVGVEIMSTLALAGEREADHQKESWTALEVNINNNQKSSNGK